jgi:hypothetical protein
MERPLDIRCDGSTNKERVDGAEVPMGGHLPSPERGQAPGAQQAQDQQPLGDTWSTHKTHGSVADEGCRLARWWIDVEARASPCTGCDAFAAKPPPTQGLQGGE